MDLLITALSAQYLPFLHLKTILILVLEIKPPQQRWQRIISTTTFNSIQFGHANKYTFHQAAVNNNYEY